MLMNIYSVSNDVIRTIPYNADISEWCVQYDVINRSHQQERVCYSRYDVFRKYVAFI